jgi:hypothetical protein
MRVFLLFLLLLPLPLSVQAEDLGELSANPFNPDSTSNRFWAGSPFKPDVVNNPFSPYGSPFSNQSATNPFATDSPRLYNQQGQYWGQAARTRMILIRPVTPTAATALSSRRARSRIPTAPGIPTTSAVPRIPPPTSFELKDPDPAAEPFHVSSWLLDTSVLHRG